MEGEIGVLYQDKKQVGGFYRWDTHVVAPFTTVDAWKVYIPRKVIIAIGYWLVEIPIDNCFDAEFYAVKDGRLVLMDAGQVAIDLPDTRTLDRRLDAPLNIKWVGVEY